MGLLHDATIVPSKTELITAWLPSRRWADGLPEIAQFGSYRFDDPAGEVGLEGVLLRDAAGSVVVHVPLTYRAAPLEGAEQHLVGTMEHSVLGTRWVYDGPGDPVFVAAITAAITSGGTGAEEYFEVDGEKVTREPRVTVRGRGAGDAAGGAVLHVVRRVGEPVSSAATLTGTWDGGSGVLAALA